MVKYNTMNTKNKPIDLKKIPYRLALVLLTAGASLILGFLSFGGMYALIPVLPLAVAAFALSAGYEGEIYLQNIKGALNKLLKRNYLGHRLAKEYLLTHFPEEAKEGRPQFFKDYQAQLELLAAFEHQELDEESKERQRHISATLKDMEQWLAQQLFPAEEEHREEQSEYSKELQQWLSTHEQKEWQERLEQRRATFNLVKIFSSLAALFMSLGSTYLIVEAFSVIPFFAAIPFALWPMMILPMALIAGTAYGMLTYNTITDLVNNNTVVKWYNKIRQDLSEGLSVRTVFMASTAALLVGLAIALTVCTAGTWWTVATNARPLFEWMSKMPSFIMGAINPIVTGASAIFFNVQNTAESLEMIDEELNNERNFFERAYQSVIDAFNHVRATENWLQIINPPRIILKLTITPLRIILFFGHLISVALTADRMPGLPQIAAALIAMISEGFEDAHYFIGSDHATQEKHHSGDKHHHHHHDVNTLLKEHLETESGHNHTVDLPTRILKIAATPIYALAALWDSWTSRLNPTEELSVDSEEQQQPSPKVLSFSQAWNKQLGIEKEENVKICPSAQRPSAAWQIEHSTALIEKKIQQLQEASVNQEVASAKISQLQGLKKQIRQVAAAGGTLEETLKQEQKNPVYNQHRMFAVVEERTATQVFIEELPERIGYCK